jgi:branched-chain amino acid aminotransferase
MNFFVYWVNEKGEKELITCPADGLILPGVMRNSVIELAQDWGIKVSERHFTIDQVVTAFKDGRLLEAFGSGTSTIICPIKNICHEGNVILFINFRIIN